MIKLVLVGATDAFLYKEAIKYLSDVVICGVVDSNIEEGRKAAHLFQAEHYAKTVSDLLSIDNFEFDGVVVKGQFADRENEALSAISNKKHVLISIPVAETSEKTAGFFNLCAESNVVTMLGNKFRYIPGYTILKNKIDSGVLGQLGLVRVHDWLGNNRDSTATIDLERIASLVDMVNWLFNSFPSVIYARSINNFYIQIHLGFEAGGMALVDLSHLNSNDGYRSVSVIGSAGAGYADDHHNQNLVFQKGSTIARSPSDGCLDIVAELSEFAEKILHKRDSQAIGSEMVTTMTIVEAIFTTIESGKAVHQKGGRYE